MRIGILLVMGFLAGCHSSAPEPVTSLGIDGTARACEVLLKDGAAGKIDRVDYGQGVKGKWLRQGDKVSAAFVADGDHTIGAVQVVGASFDILRSHCYGKDGMDIAAAVRR
jgi:hypothetical protein